MTWKDVQVRSCIRLDSSSLQNRCLDKIEGCNRSILISPIDRRSLFSLSDSLLSLPLDRHVRARQSFWSFSLAQRLLWDGIQINMSSHAVSTIVKNNGCPLLSSLLVIRLVFPFAPIKNLIESVLCLRLMLFLLFFITRCRQSISCAMIRWIIMSKNCSHSISGFLFLRMTRMTTHFHLISLIFDKHACFLLYHRLISASQRMNS
jgi:hypothetical protein